jgi:hypothetical protein
MTVLMLMNIELLIKFKNEISFSFNSESQAQNSIFYKNQFYLLNN